MLKKIIVALGLCAVYFVFIANNNFEILTEPTTQLENHQSGLEIVDVTDAHDAAEYGMFTIVEFYTEECSACKKLKTYYDMFLPLRPDVAVRRIKLPNRWVMEHVSVEYNLDIRATPHILIFDKKGKLMEEDDGTSRDASSLLIDWMSVTINGKV